MAVLIASLLLSGFGIADATAHAELESMTPAAGSTVTSSPTSVQLLFGEEIADLGSTIVVLDPMGNSVQSGEPQVDGMVIAIDLMPLTTTGTYRVNFRVLSSDGHIVNGSESFEYAPSANAIASETAIPEASILVPAPETSAVTENDSTIAFWMTGFLMAFGLLAAIIAWRAKR